MATTDTKQNAIVIVREFEAPRDLVWKVWNEKEHIEKWFGPKGFDTRVDHLDFQEGGEMRLVMIDASGTEFPSKGVFIEIDAPRKVVSTDDFGEGIDQIEALKDVKLPEGMVTTAEFEDLGERCRLTLTIGHPTEEDRKRHEDMGVVGGWNSSLDKMDDYLAEINAK